MAPLLIRVNTNKKNATTIRSPFGPNKEMQLLPIRLKPGIPIRINKNN